ncbi:MAG: hypothetical protein ACKO6K_08780, partial [Chitinophagaceae bacterium]
WQFSTDNITYTTLNGVTSTTYTTPALTTTTYYRTLVTNGVCPSATSVTNTLIVKQPSQVGTASTSASSVCPGGNVTLTLNGATGTIQWQSSTDGTNFTNISGATTSSYTTTGGISSNTSFRAVVTNSPCTSVTSNIVAVTTVEAPPGNITVSGGTTVCVGSATPITLTLNGYSGLVEKWQYTNSADFTGTVFDTAVTATSLTISGLNATRSYRAVLTNGSCTSNTGYATITVTSAPSAGTVSGAGAVCYDGTRTLTLTGASGSIQWQSSSDNSTYTDISNAISATYAPSNIRVATYYRAKVSTAACGSPSYSNAVQVTVDPTSVAGTISGANALCTNNKDTLVLSGYTGTIQWQSATSLGGTYTNISGANGASYITPN